MKLVAYHFNDSFDNGYQCKHFELDDMRVLYRYYEDGEDDSIASDLLLCWLDDIFVGYSADVMDAILLLKQGKVFTFKTDLGVIGIAQNKEDAIREAVFFEFDSIYGVNVQDIIDE